MKVTVFFYWLWYINTVLIDAGFVLVLAQQITMAHPHLFQRSLFHRSKWLTTHFIPQSVSPEASLCDRCLAERRIYRMRFVTPAQTQLPNSSPISSISPLNITIIYITIPYSVHSPPLVAQLIERAQQWWIDWSGRLPRILPSSSNPPPSPLSLNDF